MNPLFKILLEKILELSNKEIVNVTYSDIDDTYKVEYKGIKVEGSFRNVLEDVATAYLVIQLVKKYGYPIENIILEKPRETGTTATFFDIFVEKQTEFKEKRKLCTLFEVKVGKISEHQELKYIWNQLIDPAFSLVNDNSKPYPKFLIFYRVWNENNILMEKIKVIDFEEFIKLPPEKREKNNLKDILLDPMITAERIPNYQDPWILDYIKLFRKSSDYDLRSFLDLQEISKVISEVKDLIWRGGKIKTERAFKFIIRLLLTKLWDEVSTREGEEYSLQIKPQDKLNIYEFINRINVTYKNALHNLIGTPLDQVREDDILTIEYEREGRPIKIDKEILFEVVKRIQKYRFKADGNNLDLLGEFFERFLWDEYKQEKGQFFTHPNLVKFVINMLQLPQKFVNKIKENEYPYILDPSCGSGTFLVEALKSIDKLIYGNYRDLGTKLEEIKGKERHWAYKLLYGIDVERDLVLTAKVNMIMHGDGSGSIFEADALDNLEDLHKLYFQQSLGGKVEVLIDFEEKMTKKLYEKFQFIITNPPFSLPLGEFDAERLKNNFSLADIFENQAKGKSKSSEIFFIERWYQLLKEGGEIGVVLPESIFDTLEYLPLRLFIFFGFKIKAIISLPEHAFAPFAAQRTNLFFAEKRKRDKALILYKSFEKINLSLNLDDEDFLNKISEIKGIEESTKFKILEIKKKNDLSQEAKSYKILLEVFPEEKYDFFVALVENIGYFRTKKTYREEPDSDDLNIVLNDYHNWLKSKLNSNFVEFKFPRSRKVSTEFIGETNDLRSDVKLLLRNREGINITDIFDIVEYKKIDINSINGDNIKYIETGNITTKGYINYIEISKNDLLLQSGDVYETEENEEKETTISNYVRILNKIRSGKITKLPAECIIIAPARVYQAKMTIIDDFFANNFYFSPDFIALKLKENNPYIKDIFEAFLLLRSKDVVNQLDKVSRIGKGGYPKLRKEDLKYVKIPQNYIETCKDETNKKIIENLIKKRRELFELTQQLSFD